MSEYQRYEFMTVDQPLTRAQLDAVNALSSHIEASSTHALIEYNWGDFKYDPIDVLHEFFDGFLYWANWGSPRLALRFPHGILPANLLEGYDLDDFVTFSQNQDYDILDISFGEMESPEEWIDYELGSLIAMRDELMDGDLRALYIVWLAAQNMFGDYGRDEDEEDEYEDEEIEDEEDEDEDEGVEAKEEKETYVPPVPPAFGKLTAAQQALAELLQVPQELLAAAARHSKAHAPSTSTDVAELIKLLSPERRNDYLVRLARSEPGLSRLLVKELRDLDREKTGAEPPTATGERVTYATLLAESTAIKVQQERERR